MNTLLFEIGTEEIPAGYIDPAVSALAAFMEKQLTASRIAFGTLETFATPRRLAVRIQDVADAQRAETTEVMGPPEKVAFDADGNPTVPAQKFAEKVGLPLDAVEIRETPKGRYLYALVEETVRPAAALLAEIFPAAVKAIPFPKTMRWAATDLAFARPIQSYVALLGEEVIPFTIEGVTSGRITSGHRFHHPDPVTIPSPDTYEETLLAAGVMAHVAKRRNAVEEAVAAVAATSGGQVISDPELVDIVTHLVEAPYPVLGSFDESFLEVPKEVLVTSMREHQKYFAVEDAEGRLLPCFIAVNNTDPKDMDLVRAGHQRVLRARLSDARFFWDTDQKSTFDQWNEKLTHVRFQAKLGTIAEKVARFRELAAWIANHLDVDGDMAADIDRCAVLCKADLECQMVYEFPEVQGIMGRAYALLAGETERVAFAIEDHYKPVASGGELPRDLTGAVVALSDKLDTLCGCFSVGLKPTGAADPFALRRASIGILQILLARDIEISLEDLVAASVDLVGEKRTEDAESTKAAVLDFIVTRLTNLLAEEGFGKDVIAAVSAADARVIPDVKRRVAAVSRMKEHPDFQPLAAAFKRVGNILKKTEGILPQVDAAKLEEAAEKDLFAAVSDCTTKVEACMKDGALDAALLEIAGLRASVDAFFEGVMVMAEDEAVRNNRLGLLAMVAALFERFADFSKISA